MPRLVVFGAVVRQTNRMRLTDRRYDCASECESWHRDNPPQRFRVQSVNLAEVFAESPGKEIIVLHDHSPNSASCVRIYSLSGTVLFEAWHNGQLDDTLWFPDRRLLVVTGVTDSPSLGELGYEISVLVYPNILMAIRIPPLPMESGPVLLDSWNQTPDNVIAWTRTIGPPEIVPVFKTKTLHRTDNLIQTELMDLGTTDSAGDPGQISLQLLIDIDGNLVRSWYQALTRPAYEPMHLQEQFKLITPQQAEALAPVNQHGAESQQHPEP